MQKKRKKNPLWTKPYNERLRGYEADKDRLLRECANLPAQDFQRRLDELIEKWHI
jgi:hypothetical protein